MSLKSIRFPARFYTSLGSNPTVLDSNFKLGDGPCGKHVTALGAQRYSVGNLAILRITQQHDDGTEKIFEYNYEDILGRVEIERL